MLEVCFDGLPAIGFEFDLEEEKPGWEMESQGDDRARFTWAGYMLDLRLEKVETQQLLHFKLTPPNGKTLSVGSYRAQISLPMPNLHSVMVPNTRKIAHTLIYYHEHRTWPENPTLYRCLIPEGFEEPAPSNHEAPFILLADCRGDNAFSAGWARSDWATKLKGEEQNDRYILSLQRREDCPFTGESLEDALVICSDSIPWMDAEEAYAREFDRYNGHPTRPAAPDWAFEPVFCTWYCYDDHIDQGQVLEVARKCKDLGFRTILIDAGWDCLPDMGFGDFETGLLGDFTAIPDRFPDMPGLIKTLHDMDMRVQLWTGPFWEGKKSCSYREKTRDFHICNEEGEAHELCPKHPGTREHFREIFAWVARTYNVDGMWIDAADSVPTRCLADHEHLDQPMGEAFVECLSAIRDGLRSVNPEAVTEARVLHANLCSKRALDVVQPSDAPKSYEFLRLAAIHIRPWTYDIVLKNDPMNWRPETDPVTIAKFLSTMVCNGVPALSIDVLTAPQEQLSLIKAWLAFFMRHQDTLIKGNFSLFGADYGRPDMMLVGDDEAVVYVQNSLTDEVVLPKPVKRMILLNCTDSEVLKLQISPAHGDYAFQAYLPDWTKAGPSVSEHADGTLSLYRAVPEGGSAILEATQSS